MRSRRGFLGALAAVAGALGLKRAEADPSGTTDHENLLESRETLFGLPIKYTDVAPYADKIEFGEPTYPAYAPSREPLRFSRWRKNLMFIVTHQSLEHPYPRVFIASNTLDGREHLEDVTSCIRIEYVGRVASARVGDRLRVVALLLKGEPGTPYLAGDRPAQEVLSGTVHEAWWDDRCPCDLKHEHAGTPAGLGHAHYIQTKEVV